MKTSTLSVKKSLLDKLKIRAIHRQVHLQTLVEEYLERMLLTKD